MCTYMREDVNGLGLQSQMSWVEDAAHNIFRQEEYYTGGGLGVVLVMAIRAGGVPVVWV